MSRHSTRPRTAPPRDLPEPDELRADLRARRDRIVAAAVEQMTTTDYQAIQVRDIAAAAGVALGTLYRYFGSKDHLMAWALLEWSSGFPPETIDGPERPTGQRIAAVYRRAARAFERQPRVYDAMVQLQATRDPHAADVYARFSAARTAAFAAALGPTDTETGSRPEDDIVLVMSSVLAESLRSCHLGICSRAEVLTRIDRAAALVAGAIGADVSRPAPSG